MHSTVQYSMQSISKYMYSCSSWVSAAKKRIFRQQQARCASLPGILSVPLVGRYSKQRRRISIRSTLLVLYSPSTLVHLLGIYNRQNIYSTIDLLCSYSIVLYCSIYSPCCCCKYQYCTQLLRSTEYPGTMNILVPMIPSLAYEGSRLTFGLYTLEYSTPLHPLFHSTWINFKRWLINIFLALPTGTLLSTYSSVFLSSLRRLCIVLHSTSMRGMQSTYIHTSTPVDTLPYSTQLG